MLGTYPLSTLPLSTLEAVVVLDEPTPDDSSGGIYHPLYHTQQRRAVVYDDNVTPAPVWLRKGSLISTVSRQGAVDGVSVYKARYSRIKTAIDRVERVDGERSGVKISGLNVSPVTRAGSVNAVKVGVKVDSGNYTIERFADVTPTWAGISSGFITAATHRLESVGDTVRGVSVGYLGAVLVKAPVEQFVDEPLQMVGRREARRAAMQIKAAWKFAGKVDSRLLELMENGTSGNS